MIGAQGKRECIESSVKRVGESRGDGDDDVRLRRWDSQRGGEHEKSGKKGIAGERERVRGVPSSGIETEIDCGQGCTLFWCGR
jgi:hypothetical protein